ncbi:hypothetical protein OG21DRAFT_1191683 [Imleria badia]|nr:hypothetical protein OG21DRAFT_1191683 [Imleria badia]
MDMREPQVIRCTLLDTTCSGCSHAIGTCSCTCNLYFSESRSLTLVGLHCDARESRPRPPNSRTEKPYHSEVLTYYWLGPRLEYLKRDRRITPYTTFSAAPAHGAYRI